MLAAPGYEDGLVRPAEALRHVQRAVHAHVLAEEGPLVTLFAGFMPVPGGVGVAEAVYAAALAGLGIPTAAATSIAITYRLITFYLPPVWGAVAMRWMRKHSYL